MTEDEFCFRLTPGELAALIDLIPRVTIANLLQEGHNADLLSVLRKIAPQTLPVRFRVDLNH